MNLRQTLSGRLFRLVFGSYVALALVVTVVQLSLEFRTVSRTVGNDLAALGDSFQDSMTKAMWELDHAQLQIMAQGLLQSAVVTGVRVVTKDGKSMVSVGDTPVLRPFDNTGLLAPFQLLTRSLVQETPLGPRALGSFSMYSSRSVVVERVQHSFLVILINSVVKTAGLWLIFFVVIMRVLARPLNQLADVVSHIEFDASDKRSVTIDYPHQDELGRLIAAMNTMRERLDSTREQLNQVHHNLEVTVKERTHHLSEALDLNSKILISSPVPMAVYAANGQCILANQALAAMLGTQSGVLIKHNFHEIKSWRTSGMLVDAQSALDDLLPRQNEVHIVSSWGTELWLSYYFLPTVIHGEKRLLVQFINESGRKLLENELRELAFHDALTHLPNRRLLADRLNQALLSSKRQNSHAALLFLDLNKFKELNDRHGHDVGDLLLIEFAARLRRAVRETDTVARLSGDEFVVMLEGLGASTSQASDYAASVIAKIHAIVNEPFTLGQVRCSVSTSIGLRMFLGDQHDARQVLKDADTAMYRAKRAPAP